MAVVVQCFHCNAVLELDEGFRGGVCRCSSCGSLLQVPRGEQDPPPAGRKIRPAAPSAAPRKPVPASPGEPGLSNSLGQSSGALSSSGLSSGMQRVHRTKPVAPAPAKSKSSPKSSANARSPGASRPGFTPLPPSDTPDHLPPPDPDSRVPQLPATSPPPDPVNPAQVFKRDGRLLWMAAAVIVAITLLVIVAVIFFILRTG
jgi:hypothetical protein